MGGSNDAYPGVFGGEQFLVSVSALVTIPVGTWTMHVASDDGRILDMQGVTFDSVGLQNNLSDGGVSTSIIGWESPTPHASSRGTFTVTVETTLTLHAMFWERTGNDSFDLMISPGYGSNGFEFLRDTVQGWAVHS
jgi:hypothetical protein